jgi:hypothetical protein
MVSASCFTCLVRYYAYSSYTYYMGTACRRLTDKDP